jgi:hypothetical protein
MHLRHRVFCAGDYYVKILGIRNYIWCHNQSGWLAAISERLVALLSRNGSAKPSTASEFSILQFAIELV